MLQGDENWYALARRICSEDRIEATRYNLCRTREIRLRLQLGAVPCLGAVSTAPVVLLASHPPLHPRTTRDDYTFRRNGWPFSALHPDAPGGLAASWRPKVDPLVALFGAQHVANSIAVVFLTPWHAATCDAGLRLPSRTRMLDLAVATAARDAILVFMDLVEPWNEHPGLATLPLTRRVHPTRAGATLSRTTLGDAWFGLCKRIEVHAWL